MNLRFDRLFERLRDKPRALLRLLRHYWKRVAAVLIIIFHILGAWASVEAVMESRTTQGAIAWAISLNTFPVVAVPAYWLLGHSDFSGYALAREATDEQTRVVVERIGEALDADKLRVDSSSTFTRGLSDLAGLPFTRGNKAELLIDGQETFDALFEAIDRAEHYILMQFFIVRADDLGQKMKERLIAKARQGVKVYFLCDNLGSLSLPASYLKEMRDAGIRAQRFVSTPRTFERLQINFRNHRKIVVVDGRVGFTGGLNIGVEYLGQSDDPQLSPWRDTFIKVEGPVVKFLQVPFAEDWLWSTRELLTNLEWTPKAAPGGQMEALCLPTGPADELDTCALFFQAAINSAEARIWIASPYFVPDHAIISSLQLAALRGVDVRILIPENSDSWIVYYSSFSYLPEVEQVGITIYRYQPGFMHQKVMLVDNDFASVGTANFDNRSFRLNFESTVAVRDKGFAAKVEEMFERDFAKSRVASAKELTEASFLFRLKARVCRLMSPLQ